jgi:hypothetical protein
VLLDVSVLLRLLGLDGNVVIPAAFRHDLGRDYLWLPTPVDQTPGLDHARLPTYWKLKDLG